MTSTFNKYKNGEVLYTEAAVAPTSVYKTTVAIERNAARVANLEIQEDIALMKEIKDPWDD